MTKTDAGLCRNCWAWNIAGELACKRCSQPLAFVPQDVAEELHEKRARKDVRKKLIVKILPFAISLVLVSGGFGAFKMFSAVARQVGPRSGPEVPAGFKISFVEPFTNRALRFDPCTKQHYVINPNGAPPHGIKDVHGSVRRLEKATGIDFVYDGISHEPGHWDRALIDKKRYGNRWSPILVSWVPFDQLFFPDDFTYGAARPYWARNSKGEVVSVGGTILLNASRTQRPGFGQGWTWGHVLMHEWGHVVGLGHVSDPQQVMHEWAKPDDGKWGDGDLAGLRAMGRESGCLEQPDVDNFEEAKVEW